MALSPFGGFGCSATKPKDKEDPFDEKGYTKCFGQMKNYASERFNSLCVLTGERGEKVFNCDIKAGKEDHLGQRYKPEEINTELKDTSLAIQQLTDYNVVNSFVKEVTLPGNAMKKTRMSFNIKPKNM